jgi:hypothetical protein
VNWIYLTHDSVAGSCENYSHSSGSIRGGKFLDRWGNYQVIRKDSVNGVSSVYGPCGNAVVTNLFMY